MPAEPKNRSVMTLLGRKDALLRRYGTMINVYAHMADMIPAVKTPQRLGQILDGSPCSLDQSRQTEKAVRHYVDRPREIMESLMAKAWDGDPAELDIGDLMVLADALCLSESDSGDGEGSPTGHAA